MLPNCLDKYQGLQVPSTGFYQPQVLQWLLANPSFPTSTYKETDLKVRGWASGLSIGAHYFLGPGFPSPLNVKEPNQKVAKGSAKTEIQGL